VIRRAVQAGPRRPRVPARQPSGEPRKEAAGAPGEAAGEAQPWRFKQQSVHSKTSKYVREAKDQVDREIRGGKEQEAGSGAKEGGGTTKIKRDARACSTSQEDAAETLGEPPIADCADQPPIKKEHGRWSSAL